jgi:elongation factor G
MEYSRYSPCLPELQQKLVEDYQRTQGLIPDEKEKEKKKKKN